MMDSAISRFVSRLNVFDAIPEEVQLPHAEFLALYGELDDRAVNEDRPIYTAAAFPGSIVCRGVAVRCAEHPERDCWLVANGVPKAPQLVIGELCKK